VGQRKSICRSVCSVTTVSGTDTHKNTWRRTRKGVCQYFVKARLFFLLSVFFFFAVVWCHAMDAGRRVGGGRGSVFNCRGIHFFCCSCVSCISTFVFRCVGFSWCTPLLTVCAFFCGVVSILPPSALPLRPVYLLLPLFTLLRRHSILLDV
jgi:hypothetical protein